MKPNGDVHLCSRKSIPLGNLREQPIVDIFYSDKMDSIRSRMLNGKKVEGCEKCYHVEEVSEVSLRKSMNLWFYEYLINDNITLRKDDVIHDGTDYSMYGWIELFKNRKPKIEWLALHASNVCNLACRGCYSLLSSKWKKDEISLGINPYPLHNQDLHTFGIDFNAVNFITMYGGEPLIMKQNEQLMDYLIHCNNINKRILQYYTNAMQMPSNKTLDVWKKIRKLELLLSIDGYKELNDYFRSGSNWAIIEQNIHSYVRYSKEYNWILKTMTVISIYNVKHLNKLHNWLKGIGFSDNCITYNLCVVPPELDIRNLPQEYKDSISNYYKTVDLPDNIKDLVLTHLMSEPNISFIAASAFSKKLDKLRGQENPALELQKYIDN